MILKPQDIVVLLKLLAKGENGWSYSSLGRELFISASEVHAGLQRANFAGLMDLSRKKPIRQALVEFLVHGVKYAFPPVRGGLTRGIPTGYAGPPLKDLLINHSNEPPPVWPDPEGSVRGYEFSPLYKSVPRAALTDQKLYELLVLVDA
ncbi:MAG: hypothetical protein L0Z48_03805, partial [candidate division Zixibacteria bacterium]|nr:hypothetical protein [candidate division Zixibacteria bacterium]